MSVTKTRLVVTISPTVADRLRTTASDLGTNVSALVEAMVVQALGDVELIAEAKRDPFRDRALSELFAPDVVERGKRILGEDEAEELHEKRKRAAVRRKGRVR